MLPRNLCFYILHWHLALMSEYNTYPHLHWFTGNDNNNKQKTLGLTSHQERTTIHFQSMLHYNTIKLYKKQNIGILKSWIKFPSLSLAIWTKEEPYHHVECQNRTDTRIRENFLPLDVCFVCCRILRISENDSQTVFPVV